MTAVRRLSLVVLTLALLAPLASRAADPKTGFQDRVFKDAEGKDAKYVLFVPESYKGDKEFPIILFLHGAGETGDDGQKQVKTGIGKAIKAREKDFPFITVFPQSQKRSWQAGGTDAERALAILDATMKEYKVDPKRVYLTGLSMGGFGTWSLAAKYPDRWAAIVPICGGVRGGDVDAAAKAIKDIPCWCFHGDADTAVKVEQSQKMIAALKKAGASPKYDEYPGVGHNSWDKAYGTKELYTWLLEQKKK